MGSYKWRYKPPIWVIIIATLLITPLITTHEPPSKVRVLGSWARKSPEMQQLLSPQGSEPSQIKADAES